MTLYERLRYRLSVLRAAIDIGLTPSTLKIALTMPRIAGASGEDDDKKKEEDDPDKVTMTKAEADQLRRKASEGEKTVRKLEAKVADLEAKAEDAEAGSDEVAKLTKQVDRLTARAEKAEKEKADLESEVENSKRQATVLAVAKRLQFRNPEVASKLIGEEDQADEAAAEKALKGLLKSEPYLKAPGNGQRDVTGTESEDGKGGEQDKTEGVEVTGQSRIATHYASNNKE